MTPQQHLVARLSAASDGSPDWVELVMLAQQGEFGDYTNKRFAGPKLELMMRLSRIEGPVAAEIGDEVAAGDYDDDTPADFAEKATALINGMGNLPGAMAGPIPPGLTYAQIQGRLDAGINQYSNGRSNPVRNCPRPWPADGEYVSHEIAVEWRNFAAEFSATEVALAAEPVSATDRQGRPRASLCFDSKTFNTLTNAGVLGLFVPNCAKDKIPAGPQYKYTRDSQGFTAKPVDPPLNAAQLAPADSTYYAFPAWLPCPRMATPFADCDGLSGPWPEGTMMLVVVIRENAVQALLQSPMEIKNGESNVLIIKEGGATWKHSQ